MKKHWRILNSFLPEKVERKNYESFFKQEHNNWILKGKPLPVSHLSKQMVLKDFAKKYNIQTLVETGTYMGDMIYSMLPHFSTLYSIELSNFFYEKAKKRFKNNDKVKLLNGDSAFVLKEVVTLLNEPCIFWLDGHYSGGFTAKGIKECPVYEELNAIFNSPLNHIVIIDDARLFIGKNDYPTIEDLKEFVKTNKPNYKLEIENDAIRLMDSL